MNWKITEETIRNLCRDGEGGVRSDPAALSIAVDGLLHALSEVQRQIDLLGLDAAKHDCCTACTDGDGQPITGLRSLVGKRVHVRANSHTLHDRIEADAEAWRHYLQPMVNQAIYDEASGRKGSRAALALSLRDALDAVGGHDE